MRPAVEIEPIVFVVDDDAAVRRFVQGLIGTVGLKVKVFDSGQSFLAFLAHLGANGKAITGCVLLDIRMPGMSGLELQKVMTVRGINLPIIFLTGYADVQMAVNAMKAGAFDFIEKPFKNDLLLDSIQKAVSVGLSANISRAEKLAVDELVSGLTARERQIMDLVVDGQTNKQIASDLEISERTVEIHRASVMSKMQANSLADLVKMLMLSDGL
jgi:two-component system response regulator FixJ